MNAQTPLYSTPCLQLDNRQNTVADDLNKTICPGSTVSIAATCFSIYAFEELKEVLKGVDKFRFLFTEPTFTADHAAKAPKSRREFFISRLSREQSLYGTEFELRLRNELTQKAIARECADWIRQKATFKSIVSRDRINGGGLINVVSDSDKYTYLPFSEFSTVGLGRDRGDYLTNSLLRLSSPLNQQQIDQFEALWHDHTRFQDVTSQIIESIAAVYNENAPEFIYFTAIYNIFHEFLEDISQDTLPNEDTGFKKSKVWNMLYHFQRDAALAIINKLEKYNGCILADSVGLGKTFTALAVMKYYESRNKNILVLCPKKLANNWNTYRDNYINNPLAEDRFNYKVLYHTDLGRKSGNSNGTDLSRLRWDTYDLVVIDESHNFRNGGKLYGGLDHKDNRYVTLLKNVIQKGVKTKVLMLSATPVNTRFNDLKNQLSLAFEGDSERMIDSALKRPIDEIFKNAQTALNRWSKKDISERTTEELLGMLDFDFFELLDNVTIARSRKHIQKYYDASCIGSFPERLRPKSHRPSLTTLDKAITYKEIFDQIDSLNLEIYTPSRYIFDSQKEKYITPTDKKNGQLNQVNRELGIRRLMGINLIKRLESSIHAFLLTLNRVRSLIDDTIHKIDNYNTSPDHSIEAEALLNVTDYDLDSDDQNIDPDEQGGADGNLIGKKLKINLADMDRVSWRARLNKDREALELLDSMMNDITPAVDCKLQELLDVLRQKVTSPINPDNKKIIIFTAFADTARYLYDHVSDYMLKNFNLNTAVITGDSNRASVRLPKNDLDTILTCFSPRSKDKALVLPDETAEIDILIATDCISEGQNLQDCDYLINYDIHWNPVRIIQRFGRIDRIGSANKSVQLVNFWPDMDLDDYIKLKSRVESRMKAVNATATGDDNLLDEDEKLELEYRKAQLKRLQNEVVDLEEMSSGVSIMDLGLNEFRLDLLEYLKQNPEVERTPMGLHAVAPASDQCPPGVIYVLKNREQSVNVDNQNRLHPFYMVYLDQKGQIICDHLHSKKLLDRLRLACRGQNKPIFELCHRFNKETKDGRNMREISRLLSKAIDAIVETKAQSDADSFFTSGTPSSLFLKSGLDAFELVCFLVIK